MSRNAQINTNKLIYVEQKTASQNDVYFTKLKQNHNVSNKTPLETHTDRIGCRSNIGGCSSANSMAVIPTAQTSHCWL